jgi:hypothetical protein
LTRTCKQLVREVSQHSLRIQRTLEDANIKLGSVQSDVLGHGGRAILNASTGAETDPERPANAPNFSKPCIGASARRRWLEPHLGKSIRHLSELF